MIEGIRGTGVIEFHNVRKFEPLHVLVALAVDFAFWRPEFSRIGSRTSRVGEGGVGDWPPNLFGQQVFLYLERVG